MLTGAALTAVALALCPGSGAAAPVVQADGDELRVDGQPFRAYGFNYEFNGAHPNLDYLAQPTRGRLRRMRADFAEAAGLGANTIRIFVELHDVMASPTRTRADVLRALRRTLAEAGAAGLMVDVTGNLAWHAEAVPAWYDRLPDAARWSVQARFWRAVAGVGARAPNILCYELTSEPVIADAPGWYTGRIADHDYVQYVVRDVAGRDPARLARAWTTLLRDAVRSRDRRHLITIGLLPFDGGPFAPANLWDLLDLITVHKYAAPGGAAGSIALIRAFAGHGRPVLLGETFAFDLPAFEDFLLGARDALDGALSFYDGRAPEDVRPTTAVDVAYRRNLISFLGLRASLLAAR
jgi:hypothetical protein